MDSTMSNMTQSGSIVNVELITIVPHCSGIQCYQLLVIRP